MSTDVFEDPIFRYRYGFERQGDVLRVEMWVEPGGGVSVSHLHPNQEERFEVLEGEVTFKVDGRKLTAAPGDRAIARPGVRHSFKNTGKEVAHVVAEAEPALELEGFLTEAAALAQAGAYTKRGIPRGFDALVRAGDFAWRYRKTVVLTGIAFPPPRLQPLMLAPLAWLGRRRARRESDD